MASERVQRQIEGLLDEAATQPLPASKLPAYLNPLANFYRRCSCPVNQKVIGFRAIHIHHCLALDHPFVWI